MIKRILIVLAVLSLLSIGTDAGIFARKSVKMPEGFEGIYLGMPIKDFLEIRPKANVDPMNRYSPDQKVDLTKPNQSLSELGKNDPLYGLSMAGMYTFRDGKLKNLLLIWVGKIDDIRRHRGNFISSCHKRWGTDYQKKILKLEPKKKNEHLAPVLVWEKENIMIAVVCTSEYDDKTLKEGGFEIILFSKDDKETMGILTGEKVEESVHNKLFRGIGITP